jgi:hypothetical protein
MERRRYRLAMGRHAAGDQRLSGGHASLEGTFSYDAWSARVRLGASGARVRALSDEAVPANSLNATRVFGFAEGAVTRLQRGDASSVTESLSGHVTVGRAFGTQFSRGVATAAMSWSGRQSIPLTLSGVYGRTSHDAPVFERLALGGGPPLLIDRSLLSQRITMPALPAGIATGSSAIAYRASLNTRPLAVYLWSGSASSVDRFSRWNRVVGAEWSISVPSIAPAGSPAARGVVGIGESLDAPFRKKVRVYASLVLNP